MKIRKAISVFLCAVMLLSTFSNTVYASVIDRLTENMASMETFKITQVISGTGPFDADNTAGNDSNEQNNIVRSFDSITYVIGFEAQTLISSDTIKEGYLCYEFVLPLKSTEATYDTESMTWCGNNVTAVANGLDNVGFDKLYKNGYILLNEMREIGGNNVLCQIMRGKYLIKPAEGISNAIPGGGTITCTIKVLGAANGTQVNPLFSGWMEYNEIKITSIPEAITVSAKLRLNIQLKHVSDAQVSGNGAFDFETGNDKALNKTARTVDGKISCIGITLQLYNENSNKGLKGCEFPSGDITFDVVTSAKFNGADSAYPLVWSYEGNNEFGQADGRTVSNYRRYAIGAAPLNYGKGSAPSDRCYNGGEWAAAQNENRVSFTVSGYEINPDYFRITDIGAGSTIPYSSNIGCFSACEMYLVTPISSDAVGQLTTTIKDVNLNATSVSNASLIAADETGISNQANINDDAIEYTARNSSGGTYTGFIRYSDNQPNVYAVDVNGTGNAENSFWENGGDSASIGQNIGIAWGMYYYPFWNIDDTVYACNSLLKFDSRALEINPDIPITKYFSNKRDNKLSGSTNTKCLYAAKPDGFDWVSDREMNNTNENSLLYFETLNALKTYFVNNGNNNGKCVGILTESRVPSGETPTVMPQTNVFSKAFFTVINDDSIVGKVYQTKQVTRFWTYGTHGSQTIPSRIDVQNGHASLPNPTGIVIENVSTPYIKATYRTDGTIVSTGSNGTTFGDSLYITPYRNEITQSILNHENVSSPVFNLDDNQRVVDFQIKPVVKKFVDTTGTETTIITVTVTLPKGLSYVTNSSYYGGVYRAMGQGQQGVIQEGTMREPVINTQDDVTTLKWIISGVIPQNTTTSETVKNIYYSCNIGDTVNLKNDIANGTQLTSTATISSTCDKRQITEGNGNVSTTTLSVSKNELVSISKLSDQPYYEHDAEIGWTLRVNNNTSESYENVFFMDTLPDNSNSYSDNDLNSHYSGKLKISEWLIKKSCALESYDSWRVFYTTDANAKGTRASDYTTNEIISGYSAGKNVNWIEVPDADIDRTSDSENIQVHGLVGKEATAVVIVGNLMSKESFVSHIYTYPTSSSVGMQKHVNILSYKNLYSTAISYVAYRELSGIAWIDSNADGIRDINERGISSVNYELLKLRDGGDAGKEADYDFVRNGTTDSNGRYVQKSCEPGTYAIRFTGNKITNFVVSPANVGEDDSVDSDANALYNQQTNVLSSAIIMGIVLPTAQNMPDLTTFTFISKNNDAGFYENTMTWGFTKIKGTDSSISLENAHFALYKCSNKQQGHTHNDPGDENSCWTFVENKVTTQNGQVIFNSLETGTYALVETQSPDGYELPNGYWIIEVNAASKIITITAKGKPTAFFTDNGTYYLPNYLKSEMPASGGVGSILFTVGGITLIGLAVALYIITDKKKKSSPKKE